MVRVDECGVKNWCFEILCSRELCFAFGFRVGVSMFVAAGECGVDRFGVHS